MHPLMQKVVSHPMRYYCKGAFIGFGFTMLTNLRTGMINPGPPISIHKDSKKFATVVLTKSLLFGSLWPYIPFSLYKNKQDFFVVGSIMDQKMDNFFINWANIW